MAETLYSTLGVDEDADVETIRRAYRELVKEAHPDVSDDPDASEQFKRLTTARDVLTDSEERSRYDRLGHEEYVANHASSDLWASESTTESDTSPTARPSPSAAGRSSRGEASDGYDRTAWLGDDGGPTKAERTASSTYRKRRHSARSGRTATTATSGEDWQYASRAYRRVNTDVGAGDPPLGRRILGVVRAVGPWLFIHVVFILSAVATAWVTFVQADTHLDLSLPALVVVVLVLGLVVFVSVVHVISQLYS
ncbi:MULTISPECIES: DnaJ domain-containing protein [Salinibaculum]|uniref:DnaJ domain-containing protein n=1 Tax=Salinibaculum TaxID=2732368 RepID=UPI0030CCFDDF